MSPRRPRRVVQVSPKGGSPKGNITVLITGERFDDFGDVKCRFGAVDLPAVYHHRGAITCVAPPLLSQNEWDIPVGRNAHLEEATQYHPYAPTNPGAYTDNDPRSAYNGMAEAEEQADGWRATSMSCTRRTAPRSAG